MPVRSLNSSVMKWPDEAAVHAAVHLWARYHGRKRSDVILVGYFGSYARGDWGVGSDVDLLVVLDQSGASFERRTAEWDTTVLPVPADLMVYTREEWERLEGRFRDTVMDEAVWVSGSPSELDTVPRPHPIEGADFGGTVTSEYLEQKRDEYKLLLERSLENLVAKLRDLPGMLRISVFGSFAKGKRDLFTDLDILVVMDTKMNSIDRLRYLYPIAAQPVDLDILCYTPEEMDRLQGTAWIEEILRSAKVLYEKKPL